jgi:hypothetical protein
VILRGSHPAVTLLKVTEADFCFHPKIPGSALEDFDAEIERDRSEGTLAFLGNTGSQAVEALGRA